MLTHKGETICAVVVTYNRKQTLKECLFALLNQTYLLDKIILIDNASSDGTPELLKGNGILANLKIDYIRLPQNIGGSGGFYEGIRKAHRDGFDWLWVMDDDCIPEKDSLFHLHEFAKHNTFAIYGPLVIDRSTGECSWHKFPTDKSFSNSLINVPGVSFNGIFINKQIIEKIGFPIKEFWIYADDVEYSLRAKKHGIKIYVVPKSILYHPMPSFVRRIKIYKYSLLVYPVLKNKNYVYFYLRNWIFVVKNYWYLIGIIPIVKKLRDSIFLLLLNKYPLKLVSKGIVDGLRQNIKVQNRFKTC